MKTRNVASILLALLLGLSSVPIAFAEETGSPEQVLEQQDEQGSDVGAEGIPQGGDDGQGLTHSAENQTLYLLEGVPYYDMTGLGSQDDYRGSEILATFAPNTNLLDDLEPLLATIDSAARIEIAREQIAAREEASLAEEGGQTLSESDMYAILDAVVVDVFAEARIIEGSEPTNPTVLVSIPASLDIAQALTVAATAKGVVAVQPNYIYRLLEDEQVEDAADTIEGFAGNDGASTDLNLNTVSDPLVGSGADQQWWLKRIGALDAWGSALLAGLPDAASSDATVVAVLDTGASLFHPDLAANLDTVRAWDVATNQAINPLDSDGGDISGHGTLVSGIIAGIANNDLMGAGLGYNKVKVLPIRVFTLDGSDPEASEPVSNTALVIAGINKVLTYNNESGATKIQVMNMGFGSSIFDSALHSAIQEANDASVITIAAGGNGNTGASSYPSDFEETISVVATDYDDERASYSDYNEHKDISAPGGESATKSGILSTSSDGGVATESGTSYAAAMVSGAAALLFAINPGLSSGALTSLLYETADDLGDEGWDEHYGWGRLNLGAAVTASQESSVMGFSADAVSVLADLPNEFLATLSVGTNAKLAIDVPGAAKVDGVRLQIYTDNTTAAQRFRFKKESDGYYSITNANSGKVIDVSGAHMVSGTVVQQYSSNGTAAQRWLLDVNIDGTVTIRSKINHDYVIDVTSGTLAAGTKLQLWLSNGTQAQRFSVNQITQSIADGFYTLASDVGTMVFDVASASRAAGANIQTYSFNASLAQKFKVSYNTSTGYYTITAVCSGLVLDVKGGQISSGTSVQQWTSNGTMAQQWSIKETSTGSGKFFISVFGGLALDVQGGSSAAGANIQIYTSNGSKAQQFIFTPVELAEEGVFVIKSGLTDARVLDVVGASTSVGAKVQVYASNDTIAQRFRLNRVAINTYTFESVLTGYVIEGASGAVSLQVSNGGNKQRWRAELHPLGGITFVNCETGLVLDIAGGSGPALQTYASNGTAAQQFFPLTCNLVAGGQYVFSSLINLQQVLDIASASLEDGAALQSWVSNNTDAQKFWIYNTGDGYFQIIASNSYKALEVENSLLGLTGRVVQKTIDSSKLSQKWYFEYAGSGSFRIVNALNGGTHALTLKSATAESGWDVGTASKDSVMTQLFRMTLLQKGSSLGSGGIANGIDVASWQPANIGWTVDYDFMIVKASGGNTYVNPSFVYQADSALARGKKVGLYHYAHESGTNSAVVEATHFVNTVRPYIGRAVLFLDFEENRSSTYNDKVWVKEFCTTVKKLTGVSCQIYVSASWASNKINGAWTELDVWLWEASWPGSDPIFSGYKPTNTYWFSPAQGMRIHQYTSNGRLTGHTGRLDMNAFYGTKEEWTYREKN